ncbi:MAG: DivIVA domain-containing protein [Christensenellaceae bacterium]|nr:DivIVA domain-containing protein [Christensenellaceae bacterium]
MTAEYIKEVKFDREKKGYSTVQVDEFLDKLREEFLGLEKQLETANAELEKYRGMEQTLTSVLVTARDNAKKMEDDAKAKAEAVVSEAEEEAKRLRLDIEADAYDFRQKKEQEKQATAKGVADLRAFYEEYRAAIAADLAAFGAKLEELKLVEETWQQRPEMVEALPENPAAEEAQPADGPAFDMGDILKNLPETDSELKAMIEELI